MTAPEPRGLSRTDIAISIAFLVALAATLGALFIGAAEEAALRDHARTHLAPAKRPKDYHRLDALPRTATGKVRRLDLPDLTGATGATRDGA